MSKSFRTPEERRHLSEIQKGKPKPLVSKALIGRKLSNNHRLNLSRSHTGYRHSAESIEKIKRSVSRAKRQLTAAGVKPSVDRGATEFFDSLNLHDGFHVQHPNVRFSELGYFADGYDSILHAWFEYDTPCHLSFKAQANDLKRQVEIIKYFKSTGKPLAAFYRINRTGVGESGMRNVLN